MFTSFVFRILKHQFRRLTCVTGSSNLGLTITTFQGSKVIQKSTCDSSSGLVWNFPPKNLVVGFFQVTAIALLQHLHGSDRARAVLLQLPDHLTEQMSWSANWGKVGFCAIPASFGGFLCWLFGTGRLERLRTRFFLFFSRRDVKQY